MVEENILTQFPMYYRKHGRFYFYASEDVLIELETLISTNLEFLVAFSTPNNQNLIFSESPILTS